MILFLTLLVCGIAILQRDHQLECQQKRDQQEKDEDQMLADYHLTKIIELREQQERNNIN